MADNESLATVRDYTVLTQLEAMMRSIDPKTLTADELEAFVCVLRQMVDKRAASSNQPDLTNVVRLSSRRAVPDVEQVWNMFTDNVRRNRGHVAKLLGIDPLPELTQADVDAAIKAYADLPTGL